MRADCACLEIPNGRSHQISINTSTPEPRIRIGNLFTSSDICSWSFLEHTRPRLQMSWSQSGRCPWSSLLARRCYAFMVHPHMCYSCGGCKHIHTHTHTHSRMRAAQCVYVHVCVCLCAHVRVRPRVHTPEHMQSIRLYHWVEIRLAGLRKSWSQLEWLVVMEDSTHVLASCDKIARLE